MGRKGLKKGLFLMSNDYDLRINQTKKHFYKVQTFYSSFIEPKIEEMTKRLIGIFQLKKGIDLKKLILDKFLQDPSQLSLKTLPESCHIEISGGQLDMQKIVKNEFDDIIWDKGLNFGTNLDISPVKGTGGANIQYILDSPIKLRLEETGVVVGELGLDKRVREYKKVDIKAKEEEDSFGELRLAVRYEADGKKIENDQNVKNDDSVAFDGILIDYKAGSDGDEEDGDEEVDEESLYMEESKEYEEVVEEVEEVSVEYLPDETKEVVEESDESSAAVEEQEVDDEVTEEKEMEEEEEEEEEEESSEAEEEEEASLEEIEFEVEGIDEYISTEHIEPEITIPSEEREDSVQSKTLPVEDTTFSLSLVDSKTQSPILKMKIQPKPSIIPKIVINSIEKPKEDPLEEPIPESEPISIERPKVSIFVSPPKEKPIPVKNLQISNNSLTIDNLGLNESEMFSEPDISTLPADSDSEPDISTLRNTMLEGSGDVTVEDENSDVLEEGEGSGEGSGEEEVEYVDGSEEGEGEEEVGEEEVEYVDGSEEEEGEEDETQEIEESQEVDESQEEEEEEEEGEEEEGEEEVQYVTESEEGDETNQTEEVEETEQEETEQEETEQEETEQEETEQEETETEQQESGSEEVEYVEESEQPESGEEEVEYVEASSSQEEQSESGEEEIEYVTESEEN